MKELVGRLWDRIPESMRLLGVLAGILDVLIVPSGVIMMANHSAHMVMPWTAWPVLLADSADWHLWEMAAGLLEVGAVYWGWTMQHESSGSSPGSSGDAFGSARWRNAKDLRLSLQSWQSKDQGKNPAGLVAGAGAAQGPVRRAWVLGKDGHNLLLGAPGAGKSLRVILPSIAVIAEAGENLLITDPKGELQQATAGYLESQGYRVVTFDLRFPERSVRWNPLAPIIHALAKGQTAEASRIAQDLAQLLAAQGSPEGSQGAFWTQSARAIGAALALYVADQADPDAKHVASMYHVLTQHAQELDALMQNLPSTHPARQAYGPLLTGSAETRQNQLSVVAVSLSLFADPTIAWLTSQSDFDARALLNPRTAVFVVVPDDSETYYPLAALFVSQILQTLANAAAAQSGGQLTVPLHMVLDEFGSLPKIPGFDKTLAVARGRGIRITLTLQSLSQLDDRYGQKTAETMRNVCNTWVYLSSNDPGTARIVSEKVGQTTIETTSRGRNWQSGSRQWSENTNTTGRALLTPDEVMRWRPDHSLVLQMGQLPAKLPARIWFDWPQSQTTPRANQNESPAASVVSPPLWTPGSLDRPDDEEIGDLDLELGRSWRGTSGQTAARDI